LNASSSSSTTTRVRTQGTMRSQQAFRSASVRACCSMKPTNPWDSATHTSRGMGGTSLLATSFWIKISPTWGPLPWVRVMLYPACTMDTMWRDVSSRFLCWFSLVAGWSFFRMAFPPMATTALVMIPFLLWPR